MLGLVKPKKKKEKQTPSELSIILARKIFITKYNLQLAPGTIDWLQNLISHFEIIQEEDITNTFEHLVQGFTGSGSGLGNSNLVASLTL